MIRCYQCAQAIIHKQQSDYLLYNKGGRVVGEYLYTNKHSQPTWIHLKCINLYNDGKERTHAKASAKK